MKHMVKAIIAGICLGGVLLIVQRSFQIDEAVFMHWYWIIAPIVILSALLINISYNIFYMNKVRQLVPLLYDGQYAEYIDGMSALLDKAKGKNLRNLLTLNLAAGYVGCKQFDTAIPMLEHLSEKKLRGSAVNLVHRINLCTSYFESGQCDKAIAVYTENQALFQKYRKNTIYAGNIAILDVIAAIINGQYEKAENLLDAARTTYHEPRFQKSFEDLGDILTNLKSEAAPTAE